MILKSIVGMKIHATHPTPDRYGYLSNVIGIEQNSGMIPSKDTISKQPKTITNIKERKDRLYLTCHADSPYLASLHIHKPEKPRSIRKRGGWDA